MWRQGLVLGLVAAVALGGYAIGAGKSNSVVLCAAKQDGSVALASHGKCDNGDKKLTIAKQGPPGAPGPAGAAGQQGATGPRGATGADGSDANVVAEGPKLVAAAAPNNCLTNTPTAAFCSYGSGCTKTWANSTTQAFAPAAFFKDAEGIVHLRGTAQATYTGGAGGCSPPVFVLPPGYRPTSGVEEFPVRTCDTGQPAAIDVKTDGQVMTQADCVNLSGITFRP